MSLILDTSVLYGSLDRRDEHHAVCRALIEDTSEERIAPATVLGELDYFIREQLQETVHAAFLRDITNGAYTVLELRPNDYVRVREICAKYRDAHIGLVDASIVAIAERLNEPKIATLDHRHFKLIRPRHVDRLELLPHLTPSRSRRKLKS